MSRANDIAVAVAAELNAAPEGTFSQSFTATRRHRPSYTNADAQTLRVVVIPKERTRERLDRSRHAHDIAVDIGVLQAIADAPTAEDDPLDAALDPLDDFTEEIADYLAERRLTDYATARWSGETAILWNPEALQQRREYMSLLTVTYTLAEAS